MIGVGRWLVRSVTRFLKQSLFIFVSSPFLFGYYSSLIFFSLTPIGYPLSSIGLSINASLSLLVYFLSPIAPTLSSVVQLLSPTDCGCFFRANHPTLLIQVKFDLVGSFLLTIPINALTVQFCCSLTPIGISLSPIGSSLSQIILSLSLPTPVYSLYPIAPSLSPAVHLRSLIVPCWSSAIRFFSTMAPFCSSAVHSCSLIVSCPLNVSPVAPCFFLAFQFLSPVTPCFSPAVQFYLQLLPASIRPLYFFTGCCLFISGRPLVISGCFLFLSGPSLFLSGSSMFISDCSIGSASESIFFLLQRR